MRSRKASRKGKDMKLLQEPWGAVGAVALSLSLAAPGDAQAELGDFGSTVVVRAWNVADFSAGGSDVAYVQHESDSGWVPVFGGYFEQRAVARAEASASAHTLRAAGYGSVTLNPSCSPCSASTPSFARGEATLWDTIRIEPDNGFGVGDTVQIRVGAALAGDVFLTGTPSDGSEWDFNVYFGPSLGASADNLFRLERYSGGLLPPIDGAVGPLSWQQTVDVTVGQSYKLQGELLAAVGGSGFYQYPIATYTNFVDFYGTGGTQIGYAPGYEGIRIVSAAGAPIAAVPEVGTSLSLTVGLATLSGIAMVRRRRDSCTQTFRA
jgi:hypothetical protein